MALPGVDTVPGSAAGAPAAGDRPVPLALTTLAGHAELGVRLARLRTFAAEVRSSMYHVTHACNLRCHGCWFFEFGFDTRTGHDARDLEAWRTLARAERERGVTLAILIGGEPSLFPRRVKVFVEAMPYVWLSTNGLRAIPIEGFENVAIAVTLFGGGPLDDELRGIRPDGKRMHGLFEIALRNYRNDRRVFFVYALSKASVPYIEDVVRRVGDNGNQVIFNYYQEYSGPLPATDAQWGEEELLERACAVREAYPHVVLSHPYFIRTLITGHSHWGRWGYDVCPSVSQSWSGNAARLSNGNPVLPLFNAYAPDLKTVNKCCTSGECVGCRDSQAISSWLLVNPLRFTSDIAQLTTWVEIAESFWRQFCWSPYHRAAAEVAPMTRDGVGARERLGAAQPSDT